ncbi:MAG: heavy metal-associated domain-containing protein [Clostridiales bacterium]
MKHIYKLEKLNCAHCATKIEDKIAKLPGVQEVTVNFIAGKMIIEASEEDLPHIMEAAAKIIHKMEPNVIVLSL